MPTKRLSTELLVIGGGTAGLRIAMQAADHGYKTILCEGAEVGGTCLNRGCIPTKALLQASHTYRAIHEAKALGITATPRLNVTILMRWVNGIIQEGRDHIELAIKKQKLLTLIRANARFIGKNEVRAGNTRIRAKKIIIATGAVTAIPPIKGLNKVPYLTSDDLFTLKRLPGSIAIIGGGYIAMECATFFAQLGSKVTILEKLPHILGMLDDDIRSPLQKHYEEQGMAIHTSVDLDEVRKQKEKIAVAYIKAKKRFTLVADTLLVATGRVPNTAHLDLQKAGIGLGEHKEIPVNAFFQTKNPSIYAVGDVNGKSLFAHAAKREGILALQNALDDAKNSLDYNLVPWAVFTEPPVAGIGLSEMQARGARCKIGIMKAPFSGAGRAKIMGETIGFVKIVYNQESRNILGAVILGAHADDLIHEIAAVMNSSSPTVDVIKKTIHTHPTLSEVFDGLREVR